MLSAAAMGCVFTAFLLPIIATMALAAKYLVDAAQYDDIGDAAFGLFLAFCALMGGAIWLLVLHEALY